MKCLSLWQPWASAVVLGTKRIETRGWYTSYRGPLLIHAAKHLVLSEMTLRLKEPEWMTALQALGNPADFDVIEEYLPFGAIIGKTDLVACKQADEITWDDLKRYGGRAGDLAEIEDQLGDFSPGRFGWLQENPVRFEKPIPYRGYQKIFDVPDEVVAGVLP